MSSLHSLKNAGIDRRAVVHPKAMIASDAWVGPYCVIGPNVILESGVKLHSHVVIEGHTVVGEGTEIFPFASIGHSPQDKKYSGEASKLIIGARNIVREYVTLQPGTLDGVMETKTGARCLFMASAHVAHDCILGDDVVLSNQATLAGHVEVGDGVIVGGFSAVHQFVRLGKGCFLSGRTGVKGDVIPYGFISYRINDLAGLNLVGLKRRGFGPQDIRPMQAAFKMLFGSSEETWSVKLENVAQSFGTHHAIGEIVSFLKSAKRPICQPAI